MVYNIYMVPGGLDISFDGQITSTALQVLYFSRENREYTNPTIVLGPSLQCSLQQT
jgi:hypothetical protein